MPEILAYPAVFNFAPDGIGVNFPDLPGCISGGKSTPEALSMARDALSLRLWSDECDRIPFPEPSDPFELMKFLEDGQMIELVDVDMQAVRSKFSGRSANKMVTMPEWLLKQGKEANINFSQLIQDALMEKLGVKHEIRRRNSSPKH